MLLWAHFWPDAKFVLNTMQTIMLTIGHIAQYCHTVKHVQVIERWGEYYYHPSDYVDNHSVPLQACVTHFDRLLSLCIFVPMGGFQWYVQKASDPKLGWWHALVGAMWDCCNWAMTTMLRQHKTFRLWWGKVVSGIECLAVIVSMASLAGTCLTSVWLLEYSSLLQLLHCFITLKCSS